MVKGSGEKEQLTEDPLIKTVDPEYFFDRYDMVKLINGVKRHLFMIVGISLFFSALGISLTYYYLTTYTAESIVLYQTENTQKLGETGFTFTAISLPTALDMIKIPSHLQAVKSILGLDLSVNELGKMIEVPIPRGESKLIRIVAVGDNPNLVVDIANTLARLAVKSSQEYERRQLIAAMESYRAKLEDVRQRLNLANQEIEKFKTKNQYFEMTADYTTLLHEYNQTRDALREAIVEYNSMLVEYENLRREFNSLPDRVAVTMESKGSPLQARIVSLQSALAEARTKFSDSNPKIKKLEDELDNLIRSGSEEDKGHQVFERNTLKEQLEVELMRMQGKVRSAQKKKQDLTARVADLEKSVAGLPKEQSSFSRLLHNKSILEDQIKELNSSLDQVQLMLNVPKGSLETYQFAEKAKPLKDSVLVKLLPFILLIFGIGAGVSTAFVIEMYDSRIWTPRQVMINYGPPCLMVFPALKSLAKDGADKKMLYFVRRLAERINQQLPGLTGSDEEQEPVTLSFISSISGEGF